MRQATRLLDWSRRSIRKGEQQMLRGVVAVPWIMLVLAARELAGLRGDWWGLLLVFLLVCVGGALLRHRDAEQRLLVYYLLCGVAAVIGVLAAIAVSAIHAVSGADGGGVPWLCLAAAATALLGFVLVQLYHRIEGLEQRLSERVAPEG